MPALRILCIRFSSLGDLMLTLPAYAALRRAYPDAEIVLATKQEYVPFFRERGAVDRVVALPRTGGTAGLVRMGAWLRRERFDLVADLHANIRSRLLCLLVGGLRTVRYAPRRRERVTLVKHGHTGAPPVPGTAERYVRALAPLGIDADPVVRGGLTMTKDEAARADTLVSADDGRPLVGVFPGAKHGPKRYPAGRVHELCGLLADRCRVVVLDTDGVMKASGSPAGVTVLNGLHEPGVLLALLARCAVLVSTDSGPMHAAAAVGTPVVALFGPTHPALGFAPAGPDGTVLHSGRACSPCSLHGSAPCRLGLNTCMGEIAPETVVTALEPHIGKENDGNG